MNATAALPALEPLLTAADVAKVLRCSRRFVYQLHRDGQLVSVQLGAKVLFRPEDVRAFVDRLARPPATVTPIAGRDTIATREG